MTLMEASARGAVEGAGREVKRLDNGQFAPKGLGRVLTPGERLRALRRRSLPIPQSSRQIAYNRRAESPRPTEGLDVIHPHQPVTVVRNEPGPGPLVVRSASGHEHRLNDRQVAELGLHADAGGKTAGDMGDGGGGQRTARSGSGRLRNFRAMSDDKLKAVIRAVTREQNDSEAMQAVLDESRRRGWDTSGLPGSRPTSAVPRGAHVRDPNAVDAMRADAQRRAAASRPSGGSAPVTPQLRSDLERAAAAGQGGGGQRVPLSPAAERRRGEINGNGHPDPATITPGAKFNLKGSGSSWGLPDGQYEAVTRAREVPGINGPSAQMRGPDGQVIEVPLNGIAHHDRVGAPSGGGAVDRAARPTRSGAAAPRQSGAHEASRTGRSPSGRLRNFRTMSDQKLQDTIASVSREGNDREALDALNAEKRRRDTLGAGGGSAPAGASRSGAAGASASHDDVTALARSKNVVAELYRDQHGHEVWRIKHGDTGHLIQSGIASDGDLKNILRDMPSSRPSTSTPQGVGDQSAALEAQRSKGLQAGVYAEHPNYGRVMVTGQARRDSTRPSQPHVVPVATHDGSIQTAFLDKLTKSPDQQTRALGYQRGGMTAAPIRGRADLSDREAKQQRLATAERAFRENPSETNRREREAARAALRGGEAGTSQGGSERPARGASGGSGGELKRGASVTINGERHTITGKHTPTRWRLRRESDGKQVTMAHDRLVAAVGGNASRPRGADGLTAAQRAERDRQNAQGARATTTRTAPGTPTETRSSAQGGAPSGDMKGQTVTINGERHRVTGKHTPTRWRLKNEANGRQVTMADDRLRTLVRNGGSGGTSGPGTRGGITAGAARAAGPKVEKVTEGRLLRSGSDSYEVKSVYKLTGPNGEDQGVIRQEKEYERVMSGSIQVGHRHFGTFWYSYPSEAEAEKGSRSRERKQHSTKADAVSFASRSAASGGAAGAVTRTARWARGAA